MTSDNQRLIAANAAVRPITILQGSDRVSEAAFDEAIRAQLSHVVIGVRGAGKDAAFERMQTVTSTRTVTMVVDLSIYLSLSDAQFKQARGRYKSGVLLIPASFDRQAEPHDAYPWNAVEEPAARWKSVCTTIYHSHAMHCDTLQSAVGDAFTLRLAFDAQDEPHASVLADALCTRFAAWHRLTTSLREALRAVRSTLLEPQRTHCHYVPLLYCGAKVSKGWTERIADPVSFLHADAMQSGWPEPRVPAALSDLFAARCEAVWSDVAQLLHAPAQADENPDAVDEPGADAADEFVCADRMTSLWYGDRKRRRRRS